MQMNRVLVGWSGGPVKGTAVNVLAFAAEGGAPNVAGILTAYTAIRSLLPASVTITVPGTGDTFEDTTGELTGSWSAAGSGSVTGNASFDLAAAGVGGCVTWNTGLIVAGRRLRGRTFLVPFATAAYAQDGTLTDAALTAMQNFGTQMLASGPIGVWHRPSPGGSDGAASGATSFRLRDRVAILTSRRD